MMDERFGKSRGWNVAGDDCDIRCGREMFSMVAGK